MDIPIAVVYKVFFKDGIIMVVVVVVVVDIVDSMGVKIIDIEIIQNNVKFLIKISEI